MITLKEWMEVCDYRITEGGEFCWKCYGSDAYTLNSWDGDHDGHSFGIIFDTKTQEVYEVQAHDYKNNRAYRIINSAYVESYQKESQANDCMFDDAWDSVKYVDLDLDSDWIEKAQAIYNGDDYDTRVEIEVRFSDEDLLTYMKAAHERDMTFNEFAEEALKQAMADYERDPEEFKNRFEKFTIQSPPFPPDNFTREEAREAVKAAKRKMKKEKEKQK